jgi:uncharacterized ion transporter superfamily protein YfcC
MPKLRLPHPLILLLGSVGIAAALTWIIPAGSYQRRHDPATAREVVIPGTYAPVARTPVGAFAAALDIPKGMVAAVEIMLTVLMTGATFGVLERTGALARLVGGLVGRTQRPRLVVIGVSLVFASLGALENMHEEIIALAPVLLVLSRGLGFGGVTALAMSIGAAVVGSAFGPTNPFQTGIALKAAGIVGLTQPALRLGMLIVAVAVWVAWTLAMTRRDDIRPEVQASDPTAATGRDVVLLLIATLPFVPYVYGVMQWDWGFNELSALFLFAGLAVGVASGRTLRESADALLKAMEGMLAAALFIGVARAISLVLSDGHVLDTIVYELAAVLAHAPGRLALLLMFPAHAMFHVPMPSVSGHAVITMPIMGPLADLLGFSRDAAVIAYQTGAGLMDAITPTNGALFAVVLGAQVSYGRWLRFAIPGMALVALVGVAGALLAG